MSDAPFMPMWWDAYLADTTHLTTEEHGAYLLLIGAMWRRGGFVPDDDSDNARIVGLSKPKWIRVKARLLPLLIVKNGEISQKKVKKTYEKAVQKIEKNRKNGSLGGRAKSRKNNQLPVANATNSLGENTSVRGNIPEPEPEPEGISKDIPEKQHDNSDEGLSNIPACLDRRDDDQKKGFAMDELHAAVSAWNDLAKELKLSEVKKFTSARQSKLRARLKDCGGLDGWMAALDKIRETPGLRGGGDTAWKASFDFLLQESRFVKLMEGGYNGWGESQKSQSGESKLMEAVFRLGKGEK